MACAATLAHRPFSSIMVLDNADARERTEMYYLIVSENLQYLLGSNYLWSNKKMPPNIVFFNEAEGARTLNLRIDSPML